MRATRRDVSPRADVLTFDAHGCVQPISGKMKELCILPTQNNATPALMMGHTFTDADNAALRRDLWFMVTQQPLPSTTTLCQHYADDGGMCAQPATSIGPGGTNVCTTHYDAALMHLMIARIQRT